MQHKINRALTPEILKGHSFSHYDFRDGKNAKRQIITFFKNMFFISKIAIDTFKSA